MQKPLQHLIQHIQEAFTKKFFNKQKKSYDNNTVTANLLPLYFGITPDSMREGVFNNIAIKISVGKSRSHQYRGDRYPMADALFERE